MANYYYLTDETPTGPFNLAEMEVLARAGQIKPNTLICQEGDQVWTTAITRPEVSALFPTQSATPTPAQDGSSAANAKSQSTAGLLAAILLGLLVGVPMIIFSQRGDQQAVSRENDGVEFGQLLKGYHAALDAARTLSDVANVRNGIEDEINALQKKRFGADEQELDKLDREIDSLQNELRIAGNWPSSALERRTPEEKLKETLAAEDKAMHEQLERSREARKITDEETRQKNELLEIARQTKLVEIDIQENSHAISHLEAAQRRIEANK